MPTSDPQTADCVFCAIVRGDVPATFLHHALETIADQIQRRVSELGAPDTSGN